MKKTRLIILSTIISSFVLLFSSCSSDSGLTNTVSFEDVSVDSVLYNKSFSSDAMTFKNVYTTSSWGDSWTGFACSTKKDTTTTGYTNQYSCYAGSGADGSSKFALAYSDSATCSFASGITHKIHSIMLTNNTYTALSMKNGDSYAKKFSSGDYFKVTITGFNADGAQTGTVDFYLADFRNGKSFICKNWEQVSLTSLGEVNKLMFTFSSTDNGSWGMNTPAYVCVDNIEYYK